MRITIGTVMLAPGTAMPSDWTAQPDKGDDGWTRVAQSLTPFRREHNLAASGWTFSFRAPGVATTAYGLNEPAMFATAMGRLVTEVLRHGCNAVEIDSVTRHRFLGFPYLRITAHPRDLRHQNPR
jgi:hypothetical protein